MSEPLMPPSKDGIYPRCVWCRRETYVMAVIPYSNREIPCTSCNKYLPESYVKNELSE